MHAFIGSLKRFLLPAVMALIALAPHAAFAQGALSNGIIHEAAISAPAEIDTWTFQANAGDYIALSIGEVLPVGVDPGFIPWIRLLNPNQAQIGSDSGALVAQLNIAATLSGTYTVRVASGDATKMGTYRLTLSKAPGTFNFTAGDQGGTMTNGGDHLGSLYRGDLDQWTFQADKNDYLALSIGEILPVGPDPGFAPWIRLIGPTGTLVGNDSGTLVAQINVLAPLSGVYTVIVGTADYYREATGSYRLMLARVPGADLTVPPGDQGGPIANGGNYPGAIHVGDLDTWTFQANLGDYVAVSIGEPPFGEVDPGFDPWIRLIGPTGVLLGNDSGSRVAQINVNVTLTGTYTVIVGSADYYRHSKGNYVLTLAQVPRLTLTIPIGDEGGPMTNGVNHTGHIDYGDLDQWTFQANKNDYLAVSIGEPPFGEVDPGFVPWIRLIGPTGTVVGNDSGNLVAQINVLAPLSGVYTVIVGTADYYRHAVGNYKLTLAKIPDTLTVPIDDQGGALVNGRNYNGEILRGDLDQWTFQASKDDMLLVAIGEPPFGEVDPGYYPWIRLISPTGVLLGNESGNWAARIAAAAPLTGTYTVIVASADYYRHAEGKYLLSVAKIPGDFTLTDGDHGGAMTNLASYTGAIYVGDMDPWTFHATKGKVVAVTISEPPFGEVDPGFSPWIRVYNPLGDLVDSAAGTNGAVANFTPQLSGRYTVVVASGDYYGHNAGNYVLSVTGATSPAFIVTPTAGAFGTISPSVPQEVQPGGTISFTLAPSVGRIATVTGTCGGTLVGTVFTTAAVNADCTVVVAFPDGPKPPTMILDKTAMTFTAVTSGATWVLQSGTQSLRLSQEGPGTVTWTATPSHAWLQVTPANGTGPGDFSVSVVPGAGLPANGTATASIAFTFIGAANNPGPVTVTLQLKPNGTTDNPFGSVDTPANNVTGVTGAIPFTGWILDDVDVTRVMICRSAFGGETAPIDVNCGGVAGIFVGFGLFIEGARPDVAAAFPNYPVNTKAGWGFMVLTNMLPNQGNGTYTFQIYAQDRENHMLMLGTRRLTASNATATLPFGAIDTPSQGGVTSGNSFVNFGWALTQNPKSIPVDGSTITVMVDGASVGNADYNHFRPDIATLFPGLANSDGAIGFKILDTTTLSNGLHTISWTVRDSGGFVEGIGSRFFAVSNGAGAVTAAIEASASSHAVTAVGGAPRADALAAAVPLDADPVIARHGWDLDMPWRLHAVGAGGLVVVRGEEVDRFELDLGRHAGETYSGYLKVGATLSALPIGSRLDREGTFTWAPGVGFVGSYDLVFVRMAEGRAVARREVRIILAPKGRGHSGTQVSIDTPRPLENVQQPFLLGGWAADLDATAGTGIDTLHVWAYPVAGGAPVFLGAAAYGGVRPDVASVHGDRFRDSGFGVTVQGLAAGTYDLQVFPWSNVTGGFAPPSLVRVTVQ